MSVLTVSISLPHDDQVLHLSCGQHLTFGSCVCGDCAFDVKLRPASCPPVAGRVTAYADHWRLDNHGGWLSVEDLEHPQDLITIRQGQVSVPIPFELARLLAAAATPIATIFGPEPEADQPTAACPALAATRELDTKAIYYAVLVTLCEPRLRVSPVATLPTAAEIAERLHRKGISLTPGSVSAQIAYLVDKLRLSPDMDQQTSRRRSWRKEALAGVAIRQGLVSADQLHDW